MAFGINKITTQATEGLQQAQEKFSHVIDNYMADYAQKLMWTSAQPEIIWLDEPTKNLHESISSFIQGKKYQIPQKTLESLKNDAYIVVGQKLFYVEKARNKITHIKLSPEQFQEFENYCKSTKSEKLDTDRIVEITQHKVNPISVKELDDMDPLQVQFSKHAMLALQESQDLITNLGKFAEEAVQYMTPEENKQITDNSAENKKSQFNQLSTALAVINADGVKAEEEKSVYESGKELLKEIGVAAVRSVPGLGKLLKVLSPFQQTIILAILAPMNQGAAAYQSYIAYKWYFDIGTQVYRAGKTANDFASEKKEGILRPMFALSKHCAELKKIAQLAKLPSDVTEQLEAMRSTLAALQVNTLLNPNVSQESLKQALSGVNETLSSLMTMYFTENNSYVVEARENEKIEATPAVSSFVSNTMDQFVRNLQQETTNLLDDSLLKDQLQVLIASLTQKNTEGYYDYLSEDQETDVSKNIKALANTFLAIEKFVKLYSSASDPAERSRALLHVKQGIDNFNKVNWEQLDENVSDENKALINALLEESMKSLTPALERIVDTTHQIELDNHLRYGSLLENLQPVVDKINDVMNNRGLNLTIDLTSLEKESKLQEKLAEVKNDNKKIVENHKAVSEVLQDLDWYNFWINEIPKQGTKLREFGLYFGGSVNFDLEKMIEEKSESLLLKLAKLREDKVLPMESKAFDQLEDRLIDDLSNENKSELLKKLKPRSEKGKPTEEHKYPHLRKKLALRIQAAKKGENKGFLASLKQITAELKKSNEDATHSQWPPKEMYEVYDAIFTARENLNDQLLDEQKYLEAITVLKENREKANTPKEKPIAVDVPSSKISAERIPHEMTQTIANVRAEVEKSMRHIFSDYAIKNILWKDDSSNVLPIKAEDSNLINLSKHSLLLLNEAEAASQQIFELLDEVRESKVKWNTISHGIKLTKVLFSLAQRINQILTIVDKSELDPVVLEKLTKIKNMVAELPTKIINSPQETHKNLNDLIGQLGGMVVDVLKSKKYAVAPNLPEFKYAKANQPEVKSSAHNKAEWFVLIEPIRDAKLQAAKLHEFVLSHLESLQEQGIAVDPDLNNEIKETATGLSDPKHKKDGYYIYAEDESTFSQSLKALFNVALGVNEATLGFSQFSGVASKITASAQAVEKISHIINDFKKINFYQLGTYSGAFIEQAMNSMLLTALNQAHQAMDLEQLAIDLHKQEEKHHLRFGVLSTPFRVYSYEIEKLYFSRGISAAPNPFTYNIDLEDRLKELIKEEKLSNLDREKYSDQWAEYKKIRSAFALKYLREEGLSVLIQAAREGDVNIDKIRILAIILADLNTLSREEALFDPKKSTKDFIADGNQVERRNLIAKVKELDPELADTLMLEALLTGEVDYTIDEINNLQYNHESLSQILDRLEASKIIELLNGDSSSLRGSVFLKLLMGVPITSESMNGYSKSDNFDRNILLTILMGAHHDSIEANQAKLTQSLASLIGRLAHADTEIGKLVFADDNMKNIVASQADNTLYHESLVNSFGYKVGVPQLIIEFILQNEAILSSIYREMHPMGDVQNMKAEYGSNSRALLNDLDSYMSKLSSNSRAAQTIREIASDYILSKDNHELRYEILKLNNAAEGSKHSKYLHLLTPDASHKYWEGLKTDLYDQVPANLVNKNYIAKQEINNLFAAKSGDVKSEPNSLDSLKGEEQARFERAFKEFDAKQRSDMRKVIDDNSSTFSSSIFASTKKVIIDKRDLFMPKRRIIAEEYQKIEEESKKFFDEWRERATYDGKKTLDAHLTNIINILNGYLEDRKSKATMGLFSIRTDKIKLIEEYTQLFVSLRDELKNSDQPLEKYIVIADELYRDLENKHNELVGTFSGRRSGVLGSKLKEITPINQSKFDPKLNKTVSLVGKIIAKIKKMLGTNLEKKGPEQKR